MHVLAVIVTIETEVKTTFNSNRRPVTGMPVVPPCSGLGQSLHYSGLLNGLATLLGILGVLH
jgi:hypothetical protein